MPSGIRGLIDCSSFVIDLKTNKYANVGIDPWNNFGIVVRLISCSRYVDVAVDFVTRLFKLMGYIFPFLNTVKTANQILLEDGPFSVSKLRYKGANVLSVQHHARRILLDYKNLQQFHVLENCIYESIDRKRTFVRPMVMKQMDDMVDYLKKAMDREQVPRSFVQILSFLNRLDDASMKSQILQNRYVSEIKLMADWQIAKRCGGDPTVNIIFRSKINEVNVIFIFFFFFQIIE